MQDVLGLGFGHLITSAVVSFCRGLGKLLQQCGCCLGQSGVIFHRAQARVSFLPGLVDVLQDALLSDRSAHVAAPAAAARQQGHGQHCCQQQRRQLFELFHDFDLLLIDGAESATPSLPIHYTPPPCRSVNIKNCAPTFFAVSLPPNAKMHLQLSLPVPGNSEFWLQVHLFFTIGFAAGKSPPFWRTAPDERHCPRAAVTGSRCCRAGSPSPPLLPPAGRWAGPAHPPRCYRSD